MMTPQWTWRNNPRFYCGNVMMWCTCHGFTKGYAIKLHRIISISTRTHEGRRMFWLQFGDKAAIEHAMPEAWKMAADRVQN